MTCRLIIFRMVIIHTNFLEKINTHILCFFYNPTYALCFTLKYIHFNLKKTKILNHVFKHKKPLHVSVLFIRPFLGGHVPLL
jgi:hypothetical protein